MTVLVCVVLSFPVNVCLLVCVCHVACRYISDSDNDNYNDKGPGSVHYATTTVP